MKNILILGGGYGGLNCAIELDKKLKDEDVKITLVSKHDYHYQTTLLHKVAAGTYSDRKARIFYRNLLKRVEFAKDCVEYIDLQKREVHARRCCYKYDYLVVALGFKANDFGIKGVKKHTHALASLNKALKLLNKIESNFKNYIFKQDPNDLKFVVCGSGFTGVEFAAELAKKIPVLCRICGLDKNLAKIYLVSRGEHVLPMFNEKMSSVAHQKLEKLGIEIVRGSVIECQEDGAIVEHDGERRKLNANNIVWSAGVRGNSVIEKSNIENKNGSIFVDGFLRIPNTDNIFVVGDCARVKQKDIIYAPTAQLASQMGAYCATNLIKLVRNKPLDEEFKFKHRGTVCSIGHTDGVGLAYGYSIYGEVAAFLKNIIENKWILTISNIMTVIKKGQFRFRSSD